MALYLLACLEILVELSLAQHACLHVRSSASIGLSCVACLQSIATLVAAVVRGEAASELKYIGPTEAAAVFMGCLGVIVITIMRCCW